MSEQVKKLECEQAIKLILEFLDNELEKVDHSAMENHLHTCRSCYSRMEFEKKLKHMVKDSKKEIASDSLKQRIKKITGNY